MIRSLALAAIAALAGTAQAAEAPVRPAAQMRERGAAPETASPLEAYRAPWEALGEKMIGTTSRAVRFDWRRKTAGIGLLGGQLLELNDFNSALAGLFVRIPFSGLTADVALTRVFTWGSSSTDLLALTPYRQAARPSRFELDANLGVPLFEGVSTARFRWIPATELVFSLQAGIRYLYYWDSMSGMDAGEVAKALFSPRLTEQELRNLEKDRLPGMKVDGSRYQLLVGFAFDIYFQSGGFIAPRVMARLPVLSGAAESNLGLWWELTLGLGWML